MARSAARIQVKGLRELRSAIRGQAGKPLRREMGQANKAVGAMIVQRLSPTPATSGAGRGAQVRPRAQAWGVVLAVGGSHRASRLNQWGRTFVPRAGKRAYILGTALKHQKQIEQEYLEGVVSAMDKAFHSSSS